MTTVETLVDASIDKPRMNAEVVGLFAATALMLAAVGLYSLVMLSVTSRTREIGLRAALGADPSHIVSSVVGEAARPVVAGVLAGVLLSAATLKVLRSVLFGVELTDGIALASVAGVLVLVSILAALGPARRAAAIDPIVALRED